MTTLPGNGDAGNGRLRSGRDDNLEFEDVDPFIAERIVAIRNRYGVDGLRQAERMIGFELAIFADSAKELSGDN